MIRVTYEGEELTELDQSSIQSLVKRLVGKGVTINGKGYSARDLSDYLKSCGEQVLTLVIDPYIISLPVAESGFLNVADSPVEKPVSQQTTKGFSVLQLIPVTVVLQIICAILIFGVMRNK